MSVIKSAGAGESGGFYNDVATQSLRFDDDSNSYLNKTLSGSSGNQRTWTYSFWFKHGSRTSIFDFLTANASGDKYFEFSMSAAQKLTFYYHDSTLLLTTQVLRDRSAWYHIAVVHDTTQGTATDRLKIYINGKKVTDYETNILNDTNLPQNFDGGVTETGVEHLIGRNQAGNNDLDGYLSDVYLLDGVAVGDTSDVLDELIEIKNGICIPKAYTGSYGTHGFHFEFKQTGTGTASTSTIGADTSGQTNHYTSNGLGAHDSNMPDSPEVNFCTLNYLDPFTGTLSEGNLKYVNTNSFRASRGNFEIPSSGKWYFEVLNTTATDGDNAIWAGVAHRDTNISAQPNNGSTTGFYGLYNDSSLGILSNGSQSSNTTNQIAANGIIQIAIDIDNDKLYVGINNSYYTNATTSAAFNASNPTQSSIDLSGYRPFVGAYQNTGVLNCGQDPSFAGAITAGTALPSQGAGVFKYAPPTGFLALCTSNLPEPTIGPNSATQADDHFNTVTYSGNDDATRTFDVGFVSDFSWFKAKASGYGHQLYDSSRGVQKRIRSNDATAEATNSEGVLDFDDSGTLLKIGTDAFLNEAGTDGVIWNWKANGGTTATNDDGDGQSTVQANTTAGFSIVTYTGSSNETYGHGLDSAPEMIWVKGRNVAHSWAVYHKELDLIDDDTFVELNTDTTRQEGSNPRFLNGTTGDSIPTSTVFKVNHYTGSSTNATNNSDTYVAYCFHSVEGYSRMGFYSGNGATDGTFAYTGFRPAWLLIKRVDTAEDWWLYDNKRDTANPLTQILYANANNAEVTGTGDNIALDFVSNGIKFRTDNVNWNASGGQYIYAAFAEAPFKYSNAR